MKVMMILKTKILRDNSKISENMVDEINNIVEYVANRPLKVLEQEGIFIFPDTVQDSEDLTDDQMILRSDYNNYHTSNLMGVIGYGNERLKIKSRFSNGDKDYFLQYLLENVMEIPNLTNLMTEGNENDDTISAMMLFPYYLRQAARKGVFKAYVRRKYNDANVHGTIDFSRHLKENIPFMGKIAYNQREYTSDNYLIELVRHTIEYILQHSFGYQLLKSVRDEVEMIIEATPSFRNQDRNKIIRINQDSQVVHAYYHEYGTLQRLCLLIFRQTNIGFGSGTMKLNGILFDGSWLWEEYINTLIGKYFYHPRNKENIGKQYLLIDDKNQRYGTIYPDFISRGNKVKQPVIADTKYKPIGNIGRQDYMQVLTYMFRFNAKTGMYIYPYSQETSNKTEDNKDKVLRLAKGNSYEVSNKQTVQDGITLIKLGLLIPQTENSYQEFSQQMKEQEELLLKDIKSSMVIE